MDLLVKIKSAHKSNDTWKKLSSSLSNNQTGCSQLKPINEGYLAFMNSPSDLSKLISSDIRERLASQGFEVVIPYNVLCKKTVIVWNIDPEIFKADNQLLIREIKVQSRTGNNRTIKVQQCP